jgi:hypothetical protein
MFWLGNVIQIYWHGMTEAPRGSLAGNTQQAT